MAGRTPRLALAAFTEVIQSSLDCITDAVLEYRSHGNEDYPNAQPHTITISEGSRTPLLCDSGIFLTFRMQYRIIELEDDEKGPWKAQTVAYYYSLEDADGDEIIAYHWHPDTTPAIAHPHLHLKRGCIKRESGSDQGESQLRPEFAHAHLPTGRVALEDIILSLIRDFGVHPMRNDWHTILENNRSRFRAVRSWS